jgi:hypothetical protein
MVHLADTTSHSLSAHGATRHMPVSFDRVAPADNRPSIVARLPGQPLPNGRADRTSDWPSGWWILPSVLGGLVIWVMIFRALAGWLF